MSEQSNRPCGLEVSWDNFEAGAKVWDDLLHKYGSYELERRITRLDSYKDYQQHWPLDIKGSVASLDNLIDSGYDLPTGALDILEEIIALESFQEYYDTLSPIQQELADRLAQGYKPREFFDEMGYPNTGGIRWHKHVMRKKHQQFKDDHEGL